MKLGTEKRERAGNIKSERASGKHNETIQPNLEASELTTYFTSNLEDSDDASSLDTMSHDGVDPMQLRDSSPAVSFRSHCRPPVNFHVNHESRTVGANAYDILFQNQKCPKMNIYLHHEIHTIIIQGLSNPLPGGATLIEYASPRILEVFRKVRCLEIQEAT